MKIDVMSRIIIFEHHAFEADIRIATLLLATDNLRGNPVHMCFILIIIKGHF